MQLPDEKGYWWDEHNENAVFFKFDDKGQVKSMNIDGAAKLRRGEPAAHIVEKALETSGMEEGLKKYYELKASPSGEYFFSEKSFNLLGFRLMKKGKINEAIKIFELNAEAYPESWNVYDSLGEAYMKNGNKELAKKYYKKSMELNPKNENGKKMLKKLEAEK